MMDTEAWVLHEGPEQSGSALDTGDFRLERFSFPDPTEDELLVEPLFGCWEGNMSHSVARQPIDICKQRGEKKVIIGSASVVRVLGAGRAATGIREGDIGLLYGGYVTDEFGYTMWAHGYDAVGSMGILAKRTKIPVKNFVPVPAGSPFALEQWAAFSVRYITAWSNWRVAHGAYRLQVSEADDPTPCVLGWGGGSTLAGIDLARRAGYRTAMITGNEARLAELSRMGIAGFDRRRFPDIEFDEKRYAADPTYKKAYQASERALLELVYDWSRGRGAAILLDYIGAPVFRASLKALGRQGVIATAGWLLGMQMPLNRARECIARHVHVFTHYSSRSECADAIAYAARTGWMPEVTEVYDWEEIPKLARAAAEGTVKSYFPVFRVNAP
jgi:NADPH:quinone reductase-like Zn-dependent oxidoreductase